MIILTIPVFFVRKNDPAADIFKREKYRFFEISITGFKRKLSFENLIFPFKVLAAVQRSVAILDTLKPIAVAGMGGYISFPAVIGAKLSGIRTVIHEQNVVLGLSNKILSFVADKVAVSFDDTLRGLPKIKSVLTGNPVRREIVSLEINDACDIFGLEPERFTVLVFGGSLGAAGINQRLSDSLKHLVDIKNRIQFIHVCGKDDLQMLTSSYNSNGMKAKVLNFIHNMHEAYAAADYVVSRAGASTVTELKMLGINALLVPYPHATANHQYFNALTLQKTGQAVVVEEKLLKPEDIASHIKHQLALFKWHKERTVQIHAMPQESLAELILEGS